jgi:hypothetical protein
LDRGEVTERLAEEEGRSHSTDAAVPLAAVATWALVNTVFALKFAHLPRDR